jgi:hypothetical protein
MFKTINAVAAFILATWVIAGIAAIIDTVIHLVMGSYFTSSFPDTIKYFSQNAIANSAFVAIITLLVFLIYSLTLVILRKPNHNTEAKWLLSFSCSISAYDNHVSTPNIDAFGERATRFETACAPAPWTIPSMYSMLCSRYPGVHGAEMFEKGHPDAGRNT